MNQVSGKTVLVTGADGFIGSHLVEGLVEAGAKVRALAYYNSFNSWGWLDSLPAKILEQVEVITGDIRDRGTVSKLMPGVDVVFHLAALIGIPYSYQSPESYIGTNITGTLNVLEEAKIHKPSRV
ncbi:SDR family NAD(P)-dependent oxidoreductase, partial [bacterium]|nr:SDR family NAD(P)-dependent oxidoreductase [bacterium]